MRRAPRWAILGTVIALVALPGSALGVTRIVEGHDHDPLQDIDARTGAVAPSAAQRAEVERLGAHATWNRFGTPQSLIRYGGFLATGLEGEPVAAARRFVRDNRALFRLSDAGVDSLELVNDAVLAGSEAHAVLFRQRFGGLDAGEDGMITVGIVGGKVAYVSSSSAGDASLAGEERLTAQEAFRRAAANVGRSVPAAAIANLRTEGGWSMFDVTGFAQPGRARLTAVPVPGADARRAYEVLVLDARPEEPLGATVFVDAENGEVLTRHNRVNSVSDAPVWKYFTANPRQTLEDTDTRLNGCFPNPAGALPPGCTVDFRTTPEAAPMAHDRPGPQGANTTEGNNARTALSSASPFTPGPDAFVRPTSPSRDYISPFRNTWQKEKCNPAVFAGGIQPASGPNTFGGTEANDVNSAIISLFTNHNRMHDWAYNLGFTERNYNLQVSNFGRGGAQGDPEIGDAQGGSLAGGNPTFTGRDNANQITANDGVAPITNMYLWQPVAGAFYPPCVDGDFDMAVIGHEYTHAISNRMVGGPDAGLTSSGDGQATSMGESYSDLTAVEYLAEHGYVPTDGENPFAVGAYVTGAQQTGVRNYGMNRSPLNYSDVQGYDGVGSGSPHDDGEIWSAANYDIRQYMIAKYDAQFPASDRALQLECAFSRVPVDRCPGNRRWMQIVFDAYLLMPPTTSMLDARDAYLAADVMRTGGANQVELWRGFAGRGFGEKASSTPPTPTGTATNDPNPVASFETPVEANEATVSFQTTGAEDGKTVRAEVYVGDYEANVTPFLDTDPDTARPSEGRLVPGSYRFIVRARGYGAFTFTRELGAGSTNPLNVAMPTNRASKEQGAVATGNGVNLDSLIDDTEATNWAVRDRAPSVAGAQATVRLAGGEQLVDRVNVSAMLHPAGNADSAADPGGQNRWTALRAFEIHACTEGGGRTCQAAGDFTKIFESAPDAFPGDFPRPTAPNYTMREFDVPDTRATHVRLVVVSNQCTGNPKFQDETLERDPNNSADCRVGSTLVPRQDRDVRTAELQVFSRAPAIDAPKGVPPRVEPPVGGLRGRRFLISRRSLALTRGGVARVRVSCRSEQRCRGTLRLRTAKRIRRGRRVSRLVIGRASFAIRGRSRGVVRVKLSSSGRELLRRERSLRVLAIASVRAQAGVAGARSSTVTTAFRLTRARR